MGTVYKERGLTPTPFLCALFIPSGSYIFTTPAYIGFIYYLLAFCQAFCVNRFSSGGLVLFYFVNVGG